MIKQFSLKDIESAWSDIYKSQVPQTLFSTYNWHKQWLNLLAENYRPLLLVWNNQIIAPFARADTQVIFSGGAEIADYLDLIGTDAVKAESFNEIIKYLKSIGIKSVYLQNIPENSSTLKNISSSYVYQEDTTPQVSLPETWIDYLVQLDRKSRHEVKRKIRKFEALYPILKFEVIYYPLIQIEDLFKLMIMDPRKKIFLNDSMKTFFKSLVTNFSENVLLYVLKHKEQIISSVLTFRLNRNLLLYNSGFDEINFSGAGFYLKCKIINWAIDNKYTSLNFLQGNERYKYELGGKDFFVYSVKLEI